MGGSLWLFLFLFVIPLVSPLSIADVNCPETHKACLQINFCDDIKEIKLMESDIMKHSTCTGTKPAWIVLRFEQKSENEWLLETYSTRNKDTFFDFFFGTLSLHIRKNLEDVFALDENSKVEQSTRIDNIHWDDTGNVTYAKFNITSDKNQGFLLQHNLKLYPQTEEQINEISNFKAKIEELRYPCDFSLLFDGCETGSNCVKISGSPYKAKCNAVIWINNGSSTQPDYQSVESIVCKSGSWIVSNDASPLDQRMIICSKNNPSKADSDDICDTEDITKKCLYSECNMNTTRKNVTCTDPMSKIWFLSDEPFTSTEFIYCKEKSWKYNVIESLRDTDSLLCAATKPVSCNVSNLNDRCETTDNECTKMTANSTQAQCDSTIWVNNGTVEQTNFIKIHRIYCENQHWIAVPENSMPNESLGNRNTLCSDHEPKHIQKGKINSDSDFCDHRHLNEKCGDSCDLKMAHHNVTCPTKLWREMIDTGNSAFIRHWISVNQIKCKNGQWKWKHDSGTDWNSIGKMEVACSATSLPQTKPLLYGTVGGSIGLLIIILIVAIILYKRRSKTSVAITNTEKSKTNTEKSTDKGSLILGVAVDPSKAEMKTWNWPEETEGTQIGSRPDAKTPPSRPDQNVANSPQPEALTETPDKNVKDTKFINVTESPTKNSSRKARRSKGKTVNVTESPKNSSRKVRRPKGKTGDVPESPKNSSRKIHRPKGKTSDVNVSPKRKSDRPKKGKTTREDVLW